MNFKPLQDRILIRRLEAESKTASGIIIPDSAQEKPHEGEVVALGTGRLLKDGTRAPSEVKVGDVVIFSQYSGTDVKIDGEMYIIMPESDLIGIRL